ncbi:MAG TPA: hypothetical protein VF483_13875 [Gemmatimonadaceae bacterium]
MRQRLVLAIVALAVLSCRDPRAEANIAQAMMDVGTNITQIQQDLGEMHNTLDSLRTVVAKQDTIISKLANLAGVPIPQRY